MALLLHAVSAAELTPVQCRQLEALGLGGYIAAPLNGLASVCMADAVESENSDCLLAYSRRVEAARAITDIIPMRYGNIFDNPSALYQSLVQHRKHFGRQLREIGGCVEMSVRIPVTPITVPIPTAATPTAATISGREYLESRQRQAQQWTTICELITASVSGHYVKSKVDDASSDSLLIIHFLVRSAQLPLFTARIRSLQATPLSISGPWAAYNFVS